MRRSISAVALVTGLMMTSFIGLSTLVGPGNAFAAPSNARTACGYDDTNCAPPVQLPPSSPTTAPATSTTAPPTTTTAPATSTTLGSAGGGAVVSPPTAPPPAVVSAPSGVSAPQGVGSGATIATPAASKSLAFTGAHVTILLLLAAIVIGGGIILLRLSRARKHV